MKDVKFVDASSEVISAAIEVHRALGPGLLESVYSRCLEQELSLRGVRFEREVAVPLIYKGVDLAVGYRLDFLVESSLVVEVKAVERLQPIHEAQVLSYLRLTGHPTALLMNFHVPALRSGLRRLALRALQVGEADG